MKTLIIATNNPHKGGEITTILRSLLNGEWTLTLLDSSHPEPEETGCTYAENAVIKAEAAAAWTGETSIADDAGLEIDALDGAPGVHSKRFEGVQTTFHKKMTRILQMLDGTSEEKRTARFNCSVAVAAPDQETMTFSAIREGRIASKPIGDGGFGYDSIFFLPELGKTMAELTPEEKNRTSHRGKVLKLVAEYLNLA